MKVASINNLQTKIPTKNIFSSVKKYALATAIAVPSLLSLDSCCDMYYNPYCYPIVTPVVAPCYPVVVAPPPPPPHQGVPYRRY